MILRLGSIVGPWGSRSRLDFLVYDLRSARSCSLAKWSSPVLLATAVVLRRRAKWSSLGDNRGMVAYCSLFNWFWSGHRVYWGFDPLACMFETHAILSYHTNRGWHRLHRSPLETVPKWYLKLLSMARFGKRRHVPKRTPGICGGSVYFLSPMCMWV